MPEPRSSVIAFNHQNILKSKLGHKLRRLSRYDDLPGYACLDDQAADVTDGKRMQSQLGLVNHQYPRLELIWLKQQGQKRCSSYRTVGELVRSERRNCMSADP